MEGQGATPGRNMSREELQAWILSVIFGTEVRPIELEQNSMYRSAIRESRTSVDGTRVRFALPETAGSTKPAGPDNPMRRARPLIPPGTNPDVPASPAGPLSLPKSSTKPTRNSHPDYFRSKSSKPVRFGRRGQR